MLSKIDLTQGGITGTLLRFTLPMIIGSLLQQCYNIADTLIVGQCIGSGALAAVGSAYTLMVFLISILLGLSMGSGTVFSLQYGAGRTDSLRRSIYVSVLLIGTVTLILNIAVFVWIHPILRILQIPKDIYGMMYDYLWIIFWGIGFTFIYNFYAALLRAIGDAVTPLWFLAVSVVLNIELDLFFILQLDWGIKGAAIATVAAQGVSALGIMGYAYVKYPELRLHRNDLHFDRHCLKEITSFSALTCVQQSVMNLGILMVQGLVNSFGTVVMAAFAAANKNRLVRLYAGTGIRKCLFHLYCPELRSEKRGTDPQRSEKCLDYHRSLLSGHFHSSLFIRQTIDADFCPPPRNGNSEHRYQLFTHRGSVLLRNRDFVPVIRILSCHPYAGNVRSAHSGIVGNPCSPFLLACRHSCHRGHRNLVVYSYRMVYSGRHRHHIL